MFISELSLGPRGWIPILNLFFLGVSQLLFARGRCGVPGREGIACWSHPAWRRREGHALRWRIRDGSDRGTDGQLELAWLAPRRAFGPAISAGWPVSCFIFWRRFREDPRWRPLAPVTLTAGVLTALLAVVFRLRFQFYLTHPALGHEATAGLVSRSAPITSRYCAGSSSWQCGSTA